MKIYCITNSITGKKYVGQSTQSIEARWRQHCSLHSGCRVIKNAILKYGIDAFSIEKIAIAESQSELDILEQFWISKLNTISPNGYNLSSGGNGAGKMSDESKEIMRALAKRPHRLVQFNEMINNPDVIAKQTAGKIERWADPSNKKRYGAAIKISLNKPDVKERRSIAMREAWSKPENKMKLLLAQSACHTKEAEAKRAVSMINAWNEPGAREKRAAAIRAAKSTPEFKARYAATNALPEVKSRRSAASTGRKHTEEWKIENSIRLTGKKRGPNKNGIGEPRSAQAHWDNPEWKAMMIAKRHASEAKRKASIEQTNALPETKLRRSLAATKWQSERKSA